jgi:hypothetical protein
MAAVDVFESEPILQGHPLLRLENAVCTPHIGYVEQDSYELYFGAAFDNVINFIAARPTNIVNPEALKVIVLFVAVIGFNVAGLSGVAATMAGTMLPSAGLALAASRMGSRYQQSRALRAFTAGMPPITVGLLLATGWILLEPTRGQWPALLLVAGTLWVMLRTKWSPLWPLGAGAA